MNEDFKRLLAKAETGDVEATVMVGDCYNRGDRVDKDDTKAHFYYKKAADSGHPSAAFMVSLGYLSGIGVAKNNANAIKYMQFAADRGVANAQFMLGNLYKEGKVSLLFKERKAARYLEMAAKQGHAKAQILLGDMNITNKGAQFSLEKGVFWIACAYLHGNNAKEESNDAMNRLNTLIQSGISGGKDRIDEVITSIKENHPSYIKNPHG